MFVGVELRQVTDVGKALRHQLARLAPAEVPLPEAPAMRAAYDSIERCAAAAKTLLAERVEQSRVWAKEGHRSAAEHLARTSGSSVGAAHAGLETSEKLRRLPATEAAVRRGELSRAQAEAITDAAAVNPGAEQSLLEVAGTGTLAELRERANRAKAAADPDPDATHRRIHRERRVRRWTDAEGGWNIQGRGTADAGALINAALDPIIDEVFRAAHRAGRNESRDAYAFDALLELVCRARGQTALPTAGDHDGAAADRSPRRSPSPNPSFLALLRVDLDALVRGRTERDELCDIAGVGAVPARVARSLFGGRDPQAGDHEGRRRCQRHPPRPGTDRGATHRPAVDLAVVHQLPVLTHPPDPTRPPQAVDRGARDDPRQPRPALRPVPQAQDARRLGLGRGQGAPTPRASERSAPPRGPGRPTAGRPLPVRYQRGLIDRGSGRDAPAASIR